MNILIHAVAIKKTGGSTRHLRNFISAIERQDARHNYFVCVSNDLGLGSSANNRIEVIKFDIGSDLYRFYWDQIELRRLVKRYGIDLIVSLLNFGSIFPNVKQINFQRSPVYFCPYYLSALTSRQKIVTSVRRKLLKMTMGASERVVVPTRAMMNMIRGFYPQIPEGKFMVLHHAFDRERFSEPQPLPIEINEKLEGIGPGITKILYVSHLMSYKGYGVLIEAARALKEWGLDFKFVVTMERSDWAEGYDRYVSMIQGYGLADNFLVLNRVPEDAVGGLYRNCDIFIFPSFCESFGFPMVEAMGSEIPIVAAGTAVNREICGDGALYYHPTDSREAAEKIRMLIQDGELRKNLIENALAKIGDAHIGWDEYVQRCLQLFDTVSK